MLWLVVGEYFIAHFAPELMCHDISIKLKSSTPTVVG